MAKYRSKITWWLDADGEYWHESSGVFVRNPQNKFLIFTRNTYPFAGTVPSGHVDHGESADVAAARELFEEVGIVGNPIKVATENIVGDSCARGSDAHRWHAYVLPYNDSSIQIQIKEEGVDMVWLSLAEALTRELTYPVRYMIEKYQTQLEQLDE